MEFGSINCPTSLFPQVSGWGLTETGKPSEVLLTTTIPYINYTECAKKIPVNTCDKFCAGNDTGKADESCIYFSFETE